jgi:arylsulfatase
VKESKTSFTGQDELILVAAYGDLACARHDFDELAKGVKRQRFYVRESVMVGKDTDGTPIVLATASGHHGRAGVIGGATIGFLVGLIVPPLPVSVAIGAATGAAVANVADHNLKTGLRHDVGETLAAGQGVVIILTSPADELWVRRALPGASTHTVVQFPKSTIASMERVIAEAMRTAAPANTE